MNILEQIKNSALSFIKSRLLILATTITTKLEDETIYYFQYDAELKLNKYQDIIKNLKGLNSKDYEAVILKYLLNIHKEVVFEPTLNYHFEQFYQSGKDWYQFLNFLNAIASFNLNNEIEKDKLALSNRRKQVAMAQAFHKDVCNWINLTKANTLEVLERNRNELPKLSISNNDQEKIVYLILYLKEAGRIKNKICDEELIRMFPLSSFTDIKSTKNKIDRLKEKIRESIFNHDMKTKITLDDYKQKFKPLFEV